jgi:hypothetical protein
MANSSVSPGPKRPHAPLPVPGQQDRRPAHVNRAERLRPRQRAGQAEDERLVTEQDLDLALVVRARVDVGREFHHVVGEVGRAVLEVVEQPAYRFVR